MPEDIPTRKNQEDHPEQVVHEEHTEDVEGLCGQNESDNDDDSDKKSNEESPKDNTEIEENDNKEPESLFPNLTPDLAEKMLILTSTSCQEGTLVWDCELCLELFRLDLKLSFGLSA